MKDRIINHWLSLEELAQRKVSYAQNFEDILLERALPHSDGFFIDVGANDPVFHSVTKRFSDRGWRGINVEPNPALCDRLRAERPRDLTLNTGVSDIPGILTFFEVPECHGWSTFLPEAASSYRRKGVSVVERPVPVTTLEAICAEHALEGGVIDFLKIDAECFERQVIRGANWRRWRPRVVLVEATWPETWEPILLENGYLFASFDGLNRFYVRVEDRGLIPALEVPVNVLDESVPYDFVRLVEQLGPSLRDQLQLARDLGPTFFRLTRRARALARRHPRLATIAKRILGVPGGAHATSDRALAS
jgi:FkbM family methyltransferase